MFEAGIVYEIYPTFFSTKKVVNFIIIFTRLDFLCFIYCRSKQARHWILKKPKCSHTSTFTSVGFDYMAGIFTIMILLYAITFGIMVLENIHFYLYKLLYRRHARM